MLVAITIASIEGILMIVGEDHHMRTEEGPMTDLEVMKHLEILKKRGTDRLKEAE